MDSFLLALTVIFLAELGDKSQLMVMVFATRFPVHAVLAGITAATMFIHGVSVGIGAVVGAAIPERTMSLLAAAAFVGFGLWALRPEPPDDDPAENVSPAGGSALRCAVAVAGSVVLAELGDKTMLATATLGANQHPIPTWLGASVGMVAADALAIAIGRKLGERLPQRALRIGSAVAFFIVLCLPRAARPATLTSLSKLTLHRSRFVVA